MMSRIPFVPLSGVVAFAIGVAAWQTRSAPGLDRAAELPNQGAPPSRLHAQLDSLPWMTTTRYPDWFRRTYRYKELVGWVSDWQSAKAADWKGVPNPEVRMGFLELDPGAIYPFHAHPAPELYYVLHGTARWTVGKETFLARPGTAVNTPPNTRHQMVNIGRDTLELVYVWWAPGGKRGVLDIPSKMLEGWDHPPRPSDRP